MPTKRQLEMDLADLKAAHDRLYWQAIDARHILSFHAWPGQKGKAIRLALDALSGKPHVPCSCVSKKEN